MSSPHFVQLYFLLNVWGMFVQAFFRSFSPNLFTDAGSIVRLQFIETNVPLYFFDYFHGLRPRFDLLMLLFCLASMPIFIVFRLRLLVDGWYFSPVLYVFFFYLLKSSQIFKAYHVIMQQLLYAQTGVIPVYMLEYDFIQYLVPSYFFATGSVLFLCVCFTSFIPEFFSFIFIYFIS